MLYVFLLKPLKAWIFEKLQVTFWPSFFHKQLTFFNRSTIKKFSLFFFASFDSFKALLGCLEKLETFANDLV